MARIHSISSEEFERVLKQLGCHFSRQRGSHRIYWRDDLKRPIVVPVCDDLPTFIIKNNLRLLGVTHDRYLEILADL